MENQEFRISDHDVESRLTRLSPTQAEALERALADIGGSGRKAGERDGLPLFLLPMAEGGLDSETLQDLAKRLPAGFPLDHREIYFDFRLGRWMRHIEPPTVAQVLDEYLEHAESPAEGLAYLRGQWHAFLKRNGL